MFAQRGVGGSSSLTELLTELERHEGIVFLATNRPFDLDEAMYRRIHQVFDFKPPNHVQRKRIWELLTRHVSIKLSDEIDWDAISLKFELTGGFIKNAVQSALLKAVGRDAANPVLTHTDILEGCKLQMRGSLAMKNFAERIVPDDGLDALVFSPNVMEQLQSIVQLEKARSVLFGSWGFGDAMRSHQGTTCLFSGAEGVGKVAAAKAIGFELGRPIKRINFPQLLRDNENATESPVVALFREARLMDAVIVLEGFSIETEGGSGDRSSSDPRTLEMLLYEMARFPGCVILTLVSTKGLDLVLHHFAPALLKQLKFLVDFPLAREDERELLWRRLIPPKAPLSRGIDFSELSRASPSFTCSMISNAVYKAAAKAALRRTGVSEISQADLMEAVHFEKDKGAGAVFQLMRNLYA